MAAAGAHYAAMPHNRRDDPMKKLVIVLCAICLMLTVVAVAKDKAASGSSWTGYISDAKCGAAKVGTEAGAACAKKCIEGGQKAVFVNDKDKSVVDIANQDAVKGHEGHHVKLSGTKGADGIHVDKVEMATAEKSDKM
jgi:hypothetical protein